MIFDKANRFCGKQIGNYKIIKCIGEGRYGVCFLAETNGERVIIKRYKSHIFRRNNGKNLYETQILSHLCHQGIPKFLDIINEKNFYGLVMEEKGGDTIETMLFKERHAFTNGEIANIGRQLIGIVQHLHEKGIVHRDIRIPNVLVYDDRVSLVDFGLARWEDNKRYTRDIDFSYFGDLLLYLLYSSFKKIKRKSQPWYEELLLQNDQKWHLRRLLKLAEPFRDIDEVAHDFQRAFIEDYQGGLTEDISKEKSR
jgi:serine/threonine protein kinase